MEKMLWSVYFEGKKGKKVYDISTMAETRQICKEKWENSIKREDIEVQAKMMSKVKYEKVMVVVRSFK